MSNPADPADLDLARHTLASVRAFTPLTDQHRLTKQINIEQLTTFLAEGDNGATKTGRRAHPAGHGRTTT